MVRLEETAERMQLSVSDDGPGIAPAEHARVFDRFYRGEGQDAPGTGLGLAIVKKAVSNLGGSIRIGPGIQGLGVSFVVVFERPTQ